MIKLKSLILIFSLLGFRLSAQNLGLENVLITKRSKMFNEYYEVKLNSNIHNGFYMRVSRKNNRIIEKGNYSESKKTGDWYLWNSDSTYTIRSYQNDTLYELKYILYGKLKNTSHFDNTLKKIIYKSFYENGNILSIQTVLKDTSFVEFYWENGMVKSSGLYLHFSQFYITDYVFEKNGVWKYFNIDGVPIYEIEYINDKEVSRKEF